MTMQRSHNPLPLLARLAGGLAAARRLITDTVLPMPGAHPAVSDRRIDSF